MVDEEDILIARLKSRIIIGTLSASEYIAYPPVTHEELVDAERQLGFALPSLLRKIYLEVGDGGFGPWYGLLRLAQESNARSSSIVGWYLGMRSMTQEDIDIHWADAAGEDKPGLWPEKLLIICDWGCNMYSCVDCSVPVCPVYREDSNISFSKIFACESSSLYRWLMDWLDGKQHFEWEQAKKIVFKER